MRPRLSFSLQTSMRNPSDFLLQGFLLTLLTTENFLHGCRKEEVRKFTKHVPTSFSFPGWNLTSCDRGTALKLSQVCAAQCVIIGWTHSFFGIRFMEKKMAASLSKILCITMCMMWSDYYKFHRQFVKKLAWIYFSIAKFQCVNVFLMARLCINYNSTCFWFILKFGGITT